MNTCRAPQLKMSPKPLTKATKISHTMIATSSQIKSNHVNIYFLFLFFYYFLFHSNGGQRERKKRKNQRNNKEIKIHMYKTKRARNTY